MKIEDFIMTDGKVSPSKTISWIIFFVFVLVVVVNSARLFERNTSGIYQVKQSYWSGNLATRFEPGLYWQGLALLTNFRAASSYKFSDKEGAKNVSAPPIIVRFNDGGRAKVYGDVRFVLPRNDQDMARIKLIFDDRETLEKELYSQIVKEAIVMTAALMSSEESYSSLRTQFSNWARDQVLNGIYIVEKKVRMIPSDDREEKGKTDNKKKSTKKGPKMVPQEYVALKTEIVDGQEVPVRKEKVISYYGIGLQQFVIEDIIYLDGLDELIGKKRKFLTKIIDVKSKAEKAVQERKTEISKGKKLVADARYLKLKERGKIILDLEKQKEQMIIEAKRDLAVAKENKSAALNNKQKLIAEGKGEAEKRRLALLADDALGMKREYYIQAWEAYKKAFMQAQLVPQVTTVQQYQGSVKGLPPGVDVLFTIEKQLQKELGLDLTF
jgi:hypothetical protein